MAKLVPSILTRSPDEILEKIKFLESFPELRQVQIDFADGVFVANQLAAPNEIGPLKTRLEVEAHLMVAEPQKYFHDLEMMGAKLIFIHFESFRSNEAALTALRNIKSLGLLRGLAINPNSPIDIFDSFIGEIDEALIMGVNPGLQGQKFIPNTYEKVRALRDSHKSVIIEVDGGVKLENIAMLAAYGADKVNVGSGIWQTPDARETIKQFLSKLKN